MVDILGILLFIFVIILAIISHEFGHLLVLSRYNPNKVLKVRRKGLRFRAGSIEHYDHLSRSALFDVYIVGIIAGLIPIFAYWDLSNPHPYYLYGMLIAYGSGSLSDFRRIWHYCIRGKA